MKILNASPGFGKPLTERQLKDFLEKSILQMHIGTIDEKQDANIHPVWYHYESEYNKIYFNTAINSKKYSNIQGYEGRNIYFCIDESNFPYRGARGKDTAKTQHDIEFNVLVAKKIMSKYYGNLENPNAKEMLDYVKSGNSVIVEIEPKYFSTWDYSDT